MDNERSLEEYVLSQDGIIFRGTYKYPVPLPWNFGQVSRAKLTRPVTHMLSEKQASSVPDPGHCSGSGNSKMSILTKLMGFYVTANTPQLLKGCQGNTLIEFSVSKAVFFQPLIRFFS